MAAIPVGETAFEGFRLIRRKPLAVLVWGLVFFLFFLAIVTWMAGLFGSFWQTISEAEGAEPSIGEALALQVHMMTFQFGIWLISILVRVVFTCAVYRAVLEPENDRFAYLRLGKTELFVGLVLLCLGIILFMLMMGGVLLGVGVTMAAWAASKPLAIGIGVLVFMALVVLFAWIGLRLSIALPMTFAERRFRFFEAWELTRGHVGSLFLVLLVLIAIVLVFELVIGGLVAAVVLSFVVGGSLTDASIEAFFQQPPQHWLAVLGPIALVGGAVLSIVIAALQAVVTAPWAAAYRALAAGAQSPSPEPANPA